MVVRREDGRLPDLLPLRHRQLSPGHRHDLHRPQLLHRRSGASAATPRKVFNFVTGYVEPQELELLAISPLDLRETHPTSTSTRRSSNATRRAARRRSGPSSTLADRKGHDRRSSTKPARPGVEVDLVIRGICCLRPGVPGLFENISVKSIIGRFLEHSRIWAFANGYALPSGRRRCSSRAADCDERATTTGGSSCWCRSRNATVHEQVLDQVLIGQPASTTEQSWRLTARTARYERVEPRRRRRFNLHDYFMTNPSLSGPRRRAGRQPCAQAEAAPGRGMT